MAGFNRKDWEDLNITREEVENLSQAFKKEEFRKLLSEYAEEITNPENRKQYQDDIVKLEAERGIECTFVNPEPGFVVKTSVDGNKKAFINICKNKAVGRPSSKPEFKDDSRGLSWSIPLCQAPGREDFDKKKNRCVVYDVIFHPDTLHLAEKNPQFKKLVIDTALNAVEESYKVNLDKKNIKLPKLGFKGLPFATVIRKKSKAAPVVSEEEVEFLNKIKYPFKPPSEEGPVIRNLDNKKPDNGKYTVPKYIIKHQSDIDMQDFTYDKNCKINAAIPKKLVIEINLPLLNSTQTVTLDIMEKSLHLLCEKPAKYKLDIQLPYIVNEETGNAKFDKDRRLLIITLPVVKANMSIRDLMKEDSGVESDLSPVGSVSNTDFVNAEESIFSDGPKDSYSVVQECNDVDVDHVEIDIAESEQDFDVNSQKNNEESDYRTSHEASEFLEPDKHYTLPTFNCNVDDDNICFVLNVKNVDPNSLVQRLIGSHGCHIKFVSVGAGFFPLHFAFRVDFKNQCNLENVTCEAWDNNVTVLIEFVKNDEAVTHYYVGLDDDSLTEHSLGNPLELRKLAEEVLSKEYEEDDEDDEEDDENRNQIDVTVESADADEVVVSIKPKDCVQADVAVPDYENSKSLQTPTMVAGEENVKGRTLSESGVDAFVEIGPVAKKSILKKRISRSLSESNAEDYVMFTNVDKMEMNGSDLCIQEENETPSIKKTVRFSNKIRQQLFRANSTILGRKNKNKKKSRNKKRALERRMSESENSEVEDKDKERDKKTKKSKQPKQKALIEVVSNGNQDKEKSRKDGEVKPEETGKKSGKSGGGKKEKKPSGVEDKDIDKGGKPKLGLKKDDKIFEFKSDLIFDLDD